MTATVISGRYVHDLIVSAREAAEYGTAWMIQQVLK
jgi:hypothetical protein